MAELRTPGELLGRVRDVLEGLEILQSAQHITDDEIASCIYQAKGTPFEARTELLVRAVMYAAQERIAQQRVRETLERELAADRGALAEARDDLALLRTSAAQAGELADSAKKARELVTEYRMQVRELEAQIRTKDASAAEWEGKYRALCNALGRPSK